jgi:hypothetical protein
MDITQDHAPIAKKSNEKGPSHRAAQQRLFSGTILLRGLTQPLNAYGYKYFSLLLHCYCFTHHAFVVPADLSQHAKSATADGLTYSDSIDKKCGKFKSEHFLPPRKN